MGKNVIICIRFGQRTIHSARKPGSLKQVISKRGWIKVFVMFRKYLSDIKLNFHPMLPEYHKLYQLPDKKTNGDVSSAG